MTLESETVMLNMLEDSTDALGRQLASLEADLSRSGLAASGVPQATEGRGTIAEQLRAIQRRHTELRAELWTYAEERRKQTGGGGADE